jgi:peptidoglycan glycosyltransferase
MPGNDLLLLCAATMLLVLTLWWAVGELPARRKSGQPLDYQRRALAWLGLVLSLGFAGLLARLLQVTVIGADRISQRSGADDTGDVLSNPRLIRAALNEGRGRVLDRNGEVLVETVAEQGGSNRAFYLPEAAHVLGYFSPLRFGLAGVEQSRNEELTGIDALTVREAIASILRPAGEQGHDVRLTIDSGLQRAAANLLAGSVGSATLIEAATGRVLAMASSPTYDPALLTTVRESDIASADDAWSALINSPDQPLLLRATSGLYPPGSTFKVVTAATALERRVVVPDTIFEDTGALTVEGRVIPEFNRPDESRSEWTVTEGLAYSLNVVFAQIGLAIGGQAYAESARGFGVGRRIPFELPVTAGQLARSDDALANPVALADTAFGQGELLVTPLHMALVMCSIANGGRLPRPMLVEAVLKPDGSPGMTTGRETWARPIGGDTAAQMVAMLYESVSYGYAARAAIPGLNVAAKTGTAESGQDAPHGWFVAAAGVDAPTHVVSVCLDYGGEGGGLALDIGRELLNAAVTR